MPTRDGIVRLLKATKNNVTLNMDLRSKGEVSS